MEHSQVPVLGDPPRVAGVHAAGEAVVQRQVAGREVPGRGLHRRPQPPEAELRHQPRVEVLRHGPGRDLPQPSLQLLRVGRGGDEVPGQHGDEAGRGALLGLARGLQRGPHPGHQPGVRPQHHHQHPLHAGPHTRLHQSEVSTGVT